MEPLFYVSGVNSLESEATAICRRNRAVSVRLARQNDKRLSLYVRHDLWLLLKCTLARNVLPRDPALAWKRHYSGRRLVLAETNRSASSS